MSRLDVSTPEQLLEATGRIHDLFFDLDDILSQNGSTIVFVLYANTGSGFGWYAADTNRVSSVLIVRCVERVEVDDTERVGRYDVNELVWADKRLKITTGIPLDLALVVRRLDLTVIDCG